MKNNEIKISFSPFSKYASKSFIWMSVIWQEGSKNGKRLQITTGLTIENPQKLWDFKTKSPLREIISSKKYNCNA